MTSLVIVFSGTEAAEYRVAGVPAAARIAREIALARRTNTAIGACFIAVPGGWSPSVRCQAELRRLAPELAWSAADATMIGARPDTLYLCGEMLPSARAILAALVHPRHRSPGIARSLVALAGVTDGDVATKPFARLGQAGAAILLATEKPGDGIVSRSINRPISRAISSVLLRIPGVTPFHATLGTAALAIAMAACLFFGGRAGLMLGAILFQAASIFDGVDGEIARATFRTSDSGAMLDSVIDAATNLAFIAGLTVNLWTQGQGVAAAAGAAALAMLVTGLCLIGQRARASGGPFTFDVVKNHFRARPTPLMRFLTMISMRDFFAAACAVLILGGLAPQALIAFALLTMLWLTITLSVLLRTRQRAA